MVWMDKGIVMEGLKLIWSFCNLKFFEFDIVEMVKNIFCFKEFVWLKEGLVMFKFK